MLIFYISDVPSYASSERAVLKNAKKIDRKENRWHCVFDRKLHEMGAIEELAIRHKHSQSTPVEASSLISNNANEIYLNKLVGYNRIFARNILFNFESVFRCCVRRKNDRMIRKTVVSMEAVITIQNFENYHQKIEPFDDETFGQFGGNQVLENDKVLLINNNNEIIGDENIITSEHWKNEFV
ncbi:hypothetical protein GLOIN_2v1875040 [Rhizophagus irregularis DAOM 181602=DAOM 197198]|uniref:Uncharacterized protein n=1 Tax=Rhizophagus irregularis (strain DAOM 181602 / DAOM 197198 / MUCL 43194) TaxID=747089 RepID=A0A2P4Q4P1_RHIID|nr:hypothetical protein GLOIN_2v1875040 [Rhizophagus irregularis DAOM 181602=DAOM 197198]POG72625.1 hypothetical protein GLOIN_2v1875040 [Rhizophagus irregularis DAOM 181602=DAOM 197198]|eukprot:XP_025179491.1 hypothetical protein GLOIN_2v1875040 [Rhizophagus irregularis DAOM 181602=DAOM 197198]